MQDTLFAAGGAPHFTGYTAWRGLVPAADLPEARRGTEISFGFGRFLIHYPLRRGTLLNVAAFVRTEAWTEEGWRIPGAPGEFRAALADYHADAREVVARVPAGTLFRWGLFGRAPLERWVADRIALLGDAAHPMLPYMAQGAAMAIEDAMVLARAARRRRRGRGRGRAPPLRGGAPPAGERGRFALGRDGRDVHRRRRWLRGGGRPDRRADAELLDYDPMSAPV